MGELLERRHFPRAVADFPTELAHGLDDGHALPEPASFDRDVGFPPPPPDLSAHMMQNMSVGGCFIKTRTPEPPGSLVMVRFALPGEPDRPMVKAVGRVAWVRTDKEGPSGMGIHFVKLEEKDLSDIRAYITGN